MSGWAAISVGGKFSPAVGPSSARGAASERLLRLQRAQLPTHWSEEGGLSATQTVRLGSPPVVPIRIPDRPPNTALATSEKLSVRFYDAPKGRGYWRW